MPRAISSRIDVLVVAVCMAMASRAACQTPGGTNDPAGAAQIEDDSNPTRPILFSIRPEFYSRSADVTQAALIFRYDQAVLRERRWLPGRRGVILRFEMPLAVTSVSGAATRAGAGDAYAQVLLVPHWTRRFAFVIGTGLVMPTASNSLLGSGKFVLAPATGPVWFFGGRGMFYVKVQNFVSVGGDSSRPDVNALLITPTFLHIFAARWWVMLDSETKTDWEHDRQTGVKSGVQIGRAVAPRFALWLKPELWWGPNQTGQWNLKLGLVWHR